MLLIVFSLFILSCDIKTDNNAYSNMSLSASSFENFLKENDKIPEEFERILIIPGVGCQGCITGAQRYFYEHHNDSSILYVFTGITDIKMFKNEIDQTYLNNNNVIVDIDNNMAVIGFHSIYPGYLGKKRAKYEFTIFEAADKL
jgi:hypothetical protein